MDSETLPLLAEATSCREPAKSTTPPPSERTQPTSVHEDQDIFAQSPEQTKSSEADDVTFDSTDLVAPDKNDMDIIQSPSIKNMDLSTTPTEVLSRTCPDNSKCPSGSRFRH